MARTVRRGRPAAIAFAAAALLLLGASGARSAAPGWTPVAHPALEGKGTIAYVGDIVPGAAGNDWLAAGYFVNADGVRDPSIWTSHDGALWTRRSLPPTLSAERRDAVTHIARRGATVVAVGQRFEGGVRVAAWRGSSSGWTALRDPSDPLLSFPGLIYALTAGPDSFLAVGAASNGRDWLVRVFSSTDGSRWAIKSTIPVPSGVAFSPGAIAATRDRIVVVGASGGQIRSGQIWTFADGTWREADLKASGMLGPYVQVGSVAYRRGVGWVAGGVDEKVGGAVRIPAFWTSTDALSWHRVENANIEMPSRYTVVNEIEAVQGRFLAVGSSPTGLAVWTSTTGKSWRSQPAPAVPLEDGIVVVAAATPRATVIVARSSTGSALYRRAVGPTWTRVDRPPSFPARGAVAVELRDVAVSGQRLVAVGNDALDRPLVLVSDDGTRWRRLAFADHSARLESVAVNRRAIVVAGWRLVRGRARIALWTAGPGLRWTRLGGRATDVVGAFVDVAADGRAFTAVALEATRRGRVTSVWEGDESGWMTRAILGQGDARCIAVGPRSAVAVAQRGSGRTAKVVAWERNASGGWSHDAELVATAAEATHCASSAGGELILGSTTKSEAIIWRRADPRGSWDGTVLSTSWPPSVAYAVAPEGNGFLVSGETGARGQPDLAVWRLRGSSTTIVGAADGVFAAPGAQSGLGIVRYRDKIVVVGRTGAGDGAVWIGPAAPEQGPGGLGG